MCHCELMQVSKRRVEAAQVGWATVPFIIPRVSCAIYSPSAASPPWACLQNPQSASPPLEPPTARVSLPLRGLSLRRHHLFRTAPEIQPSGARFSFSFSSRPLRSNPRIETPLRAMQQEPAPARSSGPQQDSAPPRAPTMPSPESLSEGHQPSPGHSPTEVLLGLGRWDLGFVDLLWW